MFFKNATIYELTDCSYTSEFLEEKLQLLKVKPLLDSQSSGAGFEHPLFSDREEVTHSINECFFSSVVFSKRNVPADQLAALTEKRIDELESQGEVLNKKRRSDLKESAYQELLKFCPPKLTKVCFYIDTKAKLLVVNDTNNKRCDLITLALRKAIGTFVCQNFELQKKPCSYITDWLSKPVKEQRIELPDFLEIDLFSTIKCKGDDGKSATIKDNAINTEALSGLFTVECRFRKHKIEEDNKEFIFSFSVISLPATTSSRNTDLKLSGISFNTESAIESYDDITGHNTDLFLMTTELRTLFKEFKLLFMDSVTITKKCDELKEIAKEAFTNVSKIVSEGDIIYQKESN